MAPVEFIIAIGENEKRRQVADAAAEIFQEVKCRGIRPVDIFEDERRRRMNCLKVAEQSGKNCMLAIRRLNVLEKGAFGLERDFMQGTEGLRREEGVATADERPELGLICRKEGLDQG